MADDPIKIGSAASGITLLPDRTRIQRNYDRPDELVRAYLCPTSSEESLTPSLYSSDIEGEFGLMYLIGSRRVRQEGLMSEIELTYTGTLDGVLPQKLNSSGYTIQEAVYTNSVTNGTLRLTYIAPTSSVKIWGTSPIDVAKIGAVTPADALGVWFVGENVAVPPYLSPDQKNAYVVDNFFFQRIATIGTSEEIIPGKFYSGTQTQQSLLFSSGV